MQNIYCRTTLGYNLTRRKVVSIDTFAAHCTASLSPWIHTSFFVTKFGKTPNRNICWNSKGAVAILHPSNWQIGKFGQTFKESAWAWSQFLVCARFDHWGHLARNEACLSSFFIRWMRIWLSELSSSDGTRFPKTLSAEGVDSVLWYVTTYIWLEDVVVFLHLYICARWPKLPKLPGGDAVEESRLVTQQLFEFVSSQVGDQVRCLSCWMCSIVQVNRSRAFYYVPFLTRCSSKCSKLC